MQKNWFKIKRILRLWLDGKTISQIEKAEAFEHKGKIHYTISKRIIQRILKTAQQISVLSNQGKTADAISRELKIPTARVQKIIEILATLKKK